MLARFSSILSFIVLALPWHAAHALEVSAVEQSGEPVAEGVLALDHAALELAIHDQVVATEARYRFINRHDAPLELSVAFALTRGELVEGFSYYNGEEKILGEVLEKQAARDVYEELAQVQRVDPGLLEQEGDRFRFRVFPVAPGENKPVHVRSIAPLPLREGWISHVIRRENLPDGDAMLALRADITDNLPIAEVQTVGFAGRVQQLSPRHFRVSFEGGREALSGDLTIRYRLAATDHALRFTAHRQGSADGAFMLRITPKSGVQAADVIGRDVVFVIDISGSMGGMPLEQTRRGLDHALSQLSARDRFDIVSFDDESYPLHGALREAAPAALTEARAHAAALQSQGGTNIHGALSRALEILGAGEDGRPRAIIFLTDGQGTTPPEVVAADMRDRARGVRIYSFGAGNGVNRFFLQRLAQDNRGLATFVERDDQIEREMKRLYDRIAMPLMVDLDLDFEGVVVDRLYPKELPDLYRDGEVVVFGRFRKPGSGKVVVRGRVQGQDRTLTLPISLPAAEPQHAHVEKLWASRRIEHLLGQIHLRGHEPELEQEVTRLGVVYDLVTPYTAFVAVPESLKSEAIKQRMREGRIGHDKKLIDSMDGIRLSQTHIPPGDPVLSVSAPQNARKVVAHFPFGLVKRLRWDALRGRWSVRFLVPRDLDDGVYTIRVRIVHADGRVSFREAPLTIDGSAPEMDVIADELAVPGVPLELDVDPFEPVREIYAYRVGAAHERVALTIDPDTGRYHGALQIPETLRDEEITVRVVARDRARNRVEQDLQIPVLPDLCCAHTEP